MAVKTPVALENRVTQRDLYTRISLGGDASKCLREPTEPSLGIRYSVVQGNVDPGRATPHEVLDVSHGWEP